MIPRSRKRLFFGKYKVEIWGLAMNKRTILKLAMRVVLTLTICITVASCTLPTSNQLLSSPTLENPAPGVGSGSFIIVTSIAELAARAKLIVVGQVVKVDDIVNMARNPDDPTKPDEEIFIVGQVYMVSVNQFLKGNEKPEIIYVVQREGFLGPSVPKNDSEIEKARAIEKYVPLSLNKEYLMFLEPMLGYPEGKYYVGVAQPWRFSVSDTKQVLPESPWEGAINFFPSQTLNNIVYQIEHPELLASPYP